MPSSRLVVAQAAHMRRQLGVNEPPFPVAAALDVANLRIADHALDDIPSDAPAYLREQVLLDALDHAFGLLDRQRSLVYLKANMIPSRRRFVTMHEVGHHYLPWQQLHGLHVDSAGNLDDDTKELYEWQANVFASETLFLGSGLTDQARDLPFDLTTAMRLAGRFGASVHATLRRYVETHHQRCFFLVLDRAANVRGKQPRHRVFKRVTSQPFRTRYPRWRGLTSVPAADVRALVGRSAPTTLETTWTIEGDGEMTRVFLQGMDNGHHLLIFGRPNDGQRFPKTPTVRRTRL